MLNILPRAYRKCEGLREKATASECKVYKANADGSRGELIKVVTADLDALYKEQTDTTYGKFKEYIFTSLRWDAIQCDIRNQYGIKESK